MNNTYYRNFSYKRSSILESFPKQAETKFVNAISTDPLVVSEFQIVAVFCQLSVSLLPLVCLLKVLLPVNVGGGIK